MELFRNKSSGKYFIYVDFEGKDKIVLVNPNNDIMSLKRSLFNESVEVDVHDFISRGLVSERQVKTYVNELSRRESEKEITKRLATSHVIEKMTHKQKDKWIKTKLKKIPGSKRQEIQTYFDDIIQNEDS